MTTTRGFRVCAAVALAAMGAVGCEPAVEPKPAQPVGPTQADLDAAHSEVARLKKLNDALRSELKQTQADLEGAQALVRQAGTLSKRQQAEAKRLADAAAAREEKRQGEIKQLNGTIADLKTLVTKLQDRLKKSSQTNQQLVGRLNQAEKAFSDLKAKRDAEQKYVNEAKDEVTRLARLIETLRQEVTKRDNQISALEMRLTGRTTAKAEPTPVWPKGPPAKTPAKPGKYVRVTARLTQVRADMGRIDAGSALGVYEGMRMAIYHGQKFVAFFQVVDVALKSSGGFILGRKTDPKVGDRVVTLPPKKPKTKGGS